MPFGRTEIGDAVSVTAGLIERVCLERKRSRTITNVDMELLLL